MRHDRCSTLAALLAVTVIAAYPVFAEESAPAAKPASTDFLKSVPDDAVLVVAGRSIDECRECLRAFVGSISPDTPVDAGPKEMLKKFVNDTGDGGGLDSSGAMAMALLLDENKDGVPIIFVPIANYDAWRAAWGDSIKKDEGEAFEYVEGQYGVRSYFVRKDSFVVFAEKTEGLDFWSKASATPLSQSRSAAMSKALADAPFALDFSLAALRKANPDAASEVESSMADATPFMGAGAAQGQVVLKVVGKIVRDAIAGFDEVTLGAKPGADGITISCEAGTVPGSVFGDIFSQQGPVDMSDLALLPANSLFAGAGGFRGDAAWKYVSDLVTEIATAAASTPEEAETGRAALLEAINTMKPTGLAENFVFAALPGTSGFPIASAAVYRAGDPAKAVDVIVKLASDPKTNPSYIRAAFSAGVTIGEPVVSDETVDGVAVKVVKQTVDFSQAEPFQKEVFEKTMGNEIVTRLAAKEGRVYLTSMDDGAALAALLAGAGGINSEKVQKTTAALGGGVSEVMFFSLPEYVAQMSAMARSFSPASPGNPPILSVPPTSQYTAAAVTFSANQAKGTISVPMEEILAAKAVFTQMMSQNFNRAIEESEEAGSTDSQLEEESGSTDSRLNEGDSN